MESRSVEIRSSVVSSRIRWTSMSRLSTTPHCHGQWLPSPFPSPPVLFCPSLLQDETREGKKTIRPGGVKSQKIKLSLGYGVFRGVEIKGGVKLPIICGRRRTRDFYDSRKENWDTRISSMTNSLHKNIVVYYQVWGRAPDTCRSCQRTTIHQ